MEMRTLDDLVVSFRQNGRGKSRTSRQKGLRPRPDGWIIGVVALIFCLQQASSQQIGLDICGCQPGKRADAMISSSIRAALPASSTSVQHICAGSTLKKQ